MDSYNAQYMSDLKRFVLSQPGPFDFLTEKEAALARSWLYSHSLGVDPHMKRLRDDQIDFSTKKRLTSFLFYEWDQRKDFYKAKHDLLAAHGAVVYYLDPQRCIYSHGGNAILLAELKTRGIKFGANLSDESVGTTSITFLKPSLPLSCIYGQMHYADIFSDYVTIAMDFSFKNYSGMCQLIVFPMSRFSSHEMTVVRAVYYMEHYHLMNIDTGVADLKNSVMDLNVTQAVLLIDANGRIMDSNHTFLSMFQTTYFDIVGKTLASVFPEMDEIMVTLQSGKNAQTYMNRNGTTYRLLGHPVVQDGVMFGIIVQITASILPQPQAVVRQQTMFSFQRMVGNSPAFLLAKQKAVMVSCSSCNIMLCGESGTGKEVFAQSIHAASPRSQKPFVAINCAAIPKDLIVSELFGYEEGAFTGSRKKGNIGKFEQANGGTLFLDEIAEMPLDMQAVLLRVLETGEVTPLGGRKSRHVDVRIITATNRDIEKFVSLGKFRLDLYYRLNVIKIDIPPLRERRTDIPQAIKHYMDYFAKKNNKADMNITPEAMKALCQYHWPGNMRQLRNVIEGAIALSKDSLITTLELPENITSDTGKSSPEQRQTPAAETVMPAVSTPDDTVSEEEKIRIALAENQGNISKTSVALGISRSTLYRRLQEYEKSRDYPNQQPDKTNFHRKPIPSQYGHYEDYERDMIHYLLFTYHGNKTKVAEKLGISKSTLYRRLHDHASLK